jgi:protein-S-isoprenylcysteine O-methyltransferase Ste14
VYNEIIITNRIYGVLMVDFKKLKKKYPRVIIILQLLWIVIFATILAFILKAIFYISGISRQIIVDVFTFPPNVIPMPYNNIGILFIPVGMFLVIWANYALLFIGKIGLRDREPMQKPSSLVLVGPYRFTRNPIYLGCLLMMFGLVIVWSSIITVFFLIVVYIIFRFVFIKREEGILEEEFGEKYLDFKKQVRRWI